MWDPLGDDKGWFDDPMSDFEMAEHIGEPVWIMWAEDWISWNPGLTPRDRYMEQG